jgi:hypothetical protein
MQAVTDRQGDSHSAVKVVIDNAAGCVRSRLVVD